MNKTALLVPLVGFLSCQPKDQLPSDAATRASGAYKVQSLIVDGDTLYSSNGRNKIGATSFYLNVRRRASDTVAIDYQENIPSSFVANFGTIPINGIRVVNVAEMNGKFRFSNNTKAPFVYESSIDGNRFYERTVGFNVDSLEARWHLDSLKSAYNPPLREIVITAQK